MRSELILLLVFFSMVPLHYGYNCTVCDQRKCPPHPLDCNGHFAIDPCECCQHCPKQQWETCGGENWEFGYCGNSLKCAAVIGEELVKLPMMGICKDLKGFPYPNYWEDDDENCPEQSGCYVQTGQCVCLTKRTCISDFRHSSQEQCMMERRSFYDYNVDENYETSFINVCFDRGCNIVDEKCICESGKCGHTYEFSEARHCNKELVNRRCANVTCQEVGNISCPRDSVATKPHTPFGECCPTVPSLCTCDFSKCNNDCQKGKRKVMIQKTSGIPGNCCDRFLCLL
ncbi:cysteine-rich motor neuron 1 protein [Bombina bombina]|uniref:cysteine-rich motor neuron 1 protein n=1 Tax=Bombina bombina TaxID=8345 RepID=UPI00235AB424|nr:cysteine-rich motor neuron 1 protein [Bombina bombina]